MFVMVIANAARETHDQNQAEKKRANHHVTGMQPDQRLKGRTEQIGPDREPFLVNQVEPFIDGPQYKSNAGGEGDAPPKMEPPKRTLFQMVFSNDDRSATAKQQNRSEPGKMQHLMRVRRDQALADVEKVSDDEDTEKR